VPKIKVLSIAVAAATVGAFRRFPGCSILTPRIHGVTRHCVAVPWTSPVLLAPGGRLLGMELRAATARDRDEIYRLRHDV
jgi:hypothetical protein